MAAPVFTGLIAAGNFNSPAGNTNSSVTTDAITTTAGLGYVALIVGQATDNSPSFTDSKGNTWVKIGSLRNDTNSAAIYYIGSLVNAGSGHTFTAIWNSGFLSVTVLEFDQGVTLNASEVTTTDSGTPFTNSVTTTVSNTRVINLSAVYATSGSWSLSATGWTWYGQLPFPADGGDWDIGLLHREQASAGACAISMTGTDVDGGQPHHMLMAAFAGTAVTAPSVNPFVQQTATVGGTATFSPTYNDSPTSYQWKKNGVDISGATSASYTTPTITSADNADFYSVVATNTGGSSSAVGAYLFVRNLKTGAGRNQGRALGGSAYPLRRKASNRNNIVQRGLFDKDYLEADVWGDYFDLKSYYPALTATASQQIPAFTQTFTGDGNLWTPDSLSNSKVWYVADNPANTITDGFLTTVADKGGTNKPASVKNGTTNLRAEIGNTLNGRTVWTSKNTGSNMGHLRSGATDIARNTGQVTIFSLVRPSSSGIVALVDVGDGYFARSALYMASGTELRISGRRLNTDTLVDIPETGLTSGTWGLFTGKYDYTNSDLYLRRNGVVTASTTSFQTDGVTADNDSLYISLGHYSNPSGDTTELPLDGLHAEHIIVKGALSDADIARVEGYLAWQWGVVASLDASHPYKSAPPFESAAGAITASQTIPAFTQAFTGTITAATTASQSVPAFSQTATAVAVAVVTGSQAIPAFSQTTTVDGVELGFTAAQTVPAFGQIATAIVRGAATATQAIPAFSQTATAVGIASINTSVNVPAFTQTATAAARASVSVAQTVPDFSQTATAANVISVNTTSPIPAFTQTFTALASAFGFNAQQTIPAFTQNFSGVGLAAASATQTIPPFDQTATADGIELAFSASQQIPAFTQSATAKAIASVQATQVLPAFTQSATGASVASLGASQTVPAFGQSFTVDAVSAGLEAFQQVPAFGQVATVVGVTQATATQVMDPFGQTATGAAIAQATHYENIPAFGQSFTAGSGVGFSAAQQVPSFDQSAQAVAVASAQAAQLVPNFGQSFTVDAGGFPALEVQAFQQVPDFEQAMEARGLLVLGAAQLVPSFAQVARLRTKFEFVLNERTYYVLPETRTYRIIPETRSYAVKPENRTFGIKPEDRDL